MSMHVKVRGRIIAAGGCAALAAILSASAVPPQEGALALRPAEAVLSIVELDAPLFERSPGSLNDCGNCSQECPEPESHKFENDFFGPDRAYDENGHGCVEGWCSAAHPESPSCEEGSLVLTDDEKMELWRAHSTGTPALLAGVASALRPGVSYNAERHALQVLGCDEGVVLSLPLSGQQEAALVASGVE